MTKMSSAKSCWAAQEPPPVYCVYSAQRGVSFINHLTPPGPLVHMPGIWAPLSPCRFIFSRILECVVAKISYLTFLTISLTFPGLQRCCHLHCQWRFAQKLWKFKQSSDNMFRCNFEKNVPQHLRSFWLWCDSQLCGGYLNLGSYLSNTKSQSNFISRDISKPKLNKFCWIQTTPIHQ